MRLRLLALASVVSLAAACETSSDDRSDGLGGAPEELVVCTGWHALCSASPDCRVSGDSAECDCMRVDETHIVQTSAIQDVEIKRLTLARCTSERPCDVDEAPVCAAIRDGTYEVDGVRYEWVSTYSYRGWCEILEEEFVPCDPAEAGYTGDRFWAICDAAPCTEIPTPPDPDRPLRCQCVVADGPFVGLGDCTGVDGGIVSSFPVSAWDFENDDYTFEMPGYEYVRGACEPVGSDPPPTE